MSDLDRPRGRKRGVALLLASILVVVGSVAASQTTTSRELEAPSPTAVDAATTGTAYCPITAEEGSGAALVLSSASVSGGAAHCSRTPKTKKSKIIVIFHLFYKCLKFCDVFNLFVKIL